MKVLERITPASGHSTAANQAPISRIPGHVSIQRTANVNVGFELVDICAVEYEKVRRLLEEIPVEDIVEELSDEEDVDETFHDALEDQPKPVHGSPVIGWASRRSSNVIDQDNGQHFPTGQPFHERFRKWYER
ncbi:MAG: hypothetical protein Q9196_006557 [Gyalolechia fulgens]